MKKISIFAVLCAIVAAGANADQLDMNSVPAPSIEENFGYVSVEKTPAGTVVTEEVVTIDRVNQLRDEVPVIVVGRFVQRTGDNKYLFQDGTGSITVEVEDDVLNNQGVSYGESVKLYGTVDRGIFKTEIDVDRIERI